MAAGSDEPMVLGRVTLEDVGLSPTTVVSGARSNILVTGLDDDAVLRAFAAIVASYGDDQRAIPPWIIQDPPRVIVDGTMLAGINEKYPVEEACNTLATSTTSAVGVATIETSEQARAAVSILFTGTPIVLLVRGASPRGAIKQLVMLAGQTVSEASVRQGLHFAVVAGRARDGRVVARCEPIPGTH